MSRMPETKRRRPRRQFDEEFRSQAVRLVLDDGKTIAIVARDLDLAPPAPRTRSRRSLTLAEREETSRGLARGCSLQQIGSRLDRAPSTIRREVQRNGG